MRHTLTAGGMAAAVVLGALAVPAAAADQAAAQAAPKKPMIMELVKGAVTRSIPLIQKSAGSFSGSVAQDCFSCHHQSLPIMTITAARQRGLAVDEEKNREQVQFLRSFADRGKDLLRRALTDEKAAAEAREMLVDPAISLGYILTPLAGEKVAADESLENAASFLMKLQAPDGRFATYFARPPMEGSDFTTTALAVRSIQAYAPKEKAAEAGRAVGLAREWLVKTAPRTTEDKAFRLMGLKWAGAPQEEITKAMRALADDQRDDGGWSQLPGMHGDAYATGQVLVALQQAGLPVMDPVYTRGCGFLLGTQKEDGSWLVEKRTPSFQPYFETEFPHGKSQFISIAGTTWATMALVQLLPPSPNLAAAR